MTGSSKIAFLDKELKNLTARFSNYFNKNLLSFFHKNIASSAKNFIDERDEQLLLKVTLATYLVCQKFEDVKAHNFVDQNFVLRLLKLGSKIGFLIAYTNSENFTKYSLFSTFQLFLTGIIEVPGSHFIWYDPDLNYYFCYFEVQKVRGTPLTPQEIKLLQKSLKQQISSISSLTPALFWPYNEEESLRQVQILSKELKNGNDLPHLSIQFQEQSQISLEFLLHFAAPRKKIDILQKLQSLPTYLNSFCRFKGCFQKKYEVDVGALSIKFNYYPFIVGRTVNLLHARRYLLKHIENAIGPFRDYNGGLFEKQQFQFETLRVNLSSFIPLFDIFAEKLFYSIYPVEKRLSLTIDDAKNLFLSFSTVMQGREIDSLLANQILIKKIHNLDSITNAGDFFDKRDDIYCQATLSLGEFTYFCYLTKDHNIAKRKFNIAHHKKLKLMFEEGAPTSLNPFYSASDMRCSVISKLLFEGLTRLNKDGRPVLAGAKHVESIDSGRKYLITLKENFWSNGEKVTAIDYINSFKNALSGHVSHPEIYDILKSDQGSSWFEIHEPNKFSLELKMADENFLKKLSHPTFFPIFGSLQEPKWFNGPFLVRDWTKEKLLLAKNPYFWDQKNIYFDEVEIKMLVGKESPADLLAKNELDWVGDPLVVMPRSLLFELHQQQLLYTKKVNRDFIISFNANHPILKSVKIRQALSAVIDYKLISAEIFPFTTAAKRIQVDAQKLFIEGLKELNWQDRENLNLKLTFSHQAKRAELALYLKKCWQKAFGINLTIEKIEWNQFRNRLEKQDFEIVFTIQAGFEDPNFYQKYAPNSSWNFGKWQSPEYSSLLQSLMNCHYSEKNLVKRQLKKIISKEVPFKTLFTYTHLFSHNPRLQNYFLSRDGCVDFSRAYFK